MSRDTLTLHSVNNRADLWRVCELHSELMFYFFSENEYSLWKQQVLQYIHDYVKLGTGYMTMM